MRTPDELRALSILLEQAMDLSEGERAAWLGSLEGEAAQLGPTLGKLLDRAAAGETADLLEQGPHFTAPVAARADGPSFAIGDAVGPYRLLHEIGRGGMGEVWLAERTDGQLKRTVALKLPLLGIRRSVLVQRFARERDILGALAHPHIARLYDAGLAQDGQPFLALEFVDGQPITAFCNARQLSTRDRIELLRQVMDAVQYAHAHLVIHRDLKPSNVLVNATGQAMLLDFGIAKLLQEAHGEASETELTQAGGRALTLDYAAPEQIMGAPVSIATDVWALGVLLYELLTGARPFQGARREIEQGILALEPPRPNGLTPDLTTIVLKALKKVPSERYATVDALSADLGRWGRGEAVLAQPDRALYRLRKFVQRNRLPAALATGAVAALAIGAGIAAWQAGVAGRERDHALGLLSRSEAVAEFLDMLMTESAQAEKPMTTSELLARSEALAAMAFRHSPEQQALVYSILGLNHLKLTGAAKAETLLRNAVELARDSGDPSFQARLACQLASSVAAAGRLNEASTALVAITRRTDIDPGTAAECLDVLSYVAAELGDGAAAVGYAEQALEKLGVSVRTSPATRASIRGDLAAALWLSGRKGEASIEYAKVLATYAALGREASAAAILIRNDWAVGHSNAGDPRSALALYDENLALLVTRGIVASSTLIGNRALALHAMGRFESASELYRAAIGAAEGASSTKKVVSNLINLAHVSLDMGRVDDARTALNRLQALELAARARGEGYDAPAVAQVRGRIALAEAQPMQARTEFTLLADGDSVANSRQVALWRRASAYLAEDQLEAALQDARLAVTLGGELQGGKPYSWRTGEALLVQGRILARAGDRVQARTSLKTALQHFMNTVDPSHPSLLLAQTLLATVN